MTVKSSPTIPEDTCSYIDMIQELVEMIGEQDDPVWRKRQADTATALLEHVRASNLALRQASKHWYDRRKIK